MFQTSGRAAFDMSGTLLCGGERQMPGPEVYFSVNTESIQKQAFKPCNVESNLSARVKKIF